MAKIIYYLSILSPLSAIVVGRKERLLLWYYAWVCLLADLCAFTLLHLNVKHSIVSNSFLLLEFVLLSRFFFSQLYGKQFFVLYSLLVAVVTAGFVWSTIDLTRIAATDAMAYNYKFATFFLMCYIVLTLMCLYKIMRTAEVVFLQRSPLFLASVGILAYAAPVFMIFAVQRLVEIKQLTILNKYWGYFFLPLNIFKNTFVALSLYYARRVIKR